MSYIFTINIHDSKKGWQGIKQIIHFKPQTSIKHIKLRINDNEITNPIEVANNFNRYFANVGSELASVIPCVKKIIGQSVFLKTTIFYLISSLALDLNIVQIMQYYQ